MWGTFFTLLSAIGPISILFTLVVMGLLSQRLGAVTKMRPLYRWFYVAAAFLGVSTILRLLGMGGPDETLSLLYSVFFVTGVTLGVVVAWRYWSWLFGERDS